MSSLTPEQEYVLKRSEMKFNDLAMYSLLSESTFHCNQQCASDDTCFKRCVTKNSALIDVLRSAIVKNVVNSHLKMPQ